MELKVPVSGQMAEILTPEALAFVEKLVRQFEPTRHALLAHRVERQKEIDAGWLPDFPSATKHIRDDKSWKVASIPADMQDRRTEITGPVDRKMVINALNSGAKVFMADFEDATCPTWHNLIDGHINLRDAVRRSISFTNPEGKQYKLNDKTATLLVRPRGWHLPEKHVLVDGKPISGSLFDFGMYFFHNAAELLRRGSGPYFYLPKMESHLEARLWNDVFNFAQDTLKIPRGSIRATVLIETILATFEAEEILYELREHSSGLNCGRWDYIFSAIKKFRNREGFTFPDRVQVTMTVPMMRAYCLHVIKTCHSRGAHAMGGMAAQIPIKNDPAANEAAMARVLADKEREASDGHDGTWVAHPGLVPIALKAFDKHMPTPNQISKQRPDVHVTAAQLLEAPKGTISEDGLRGNIRVGVQYLEAWLGGNGCVPLYNLMEDAATAEISRAQIWQWLKHNAALADGRKITNHLYDEILPQEMARIEKEVGPARFSSGHYAQAAKMFSEMSKSAEFAEFLTLPAYQMID
ncbi:MAG TPA: malate synthase A [Verrucomicrobiae bacterium]|nr:malate synthase A [Verrucomicrobiae bacterium]